MSTVEVKGLAEFNMAIARVRELLPDVAQTVALNAALLVVQSAVPTVPRRSGRAARSIQGYVSNQGASVTGGQGVDYYRWLELGGASGRNHSNKRPIVQDGRYLNPAYERNKVRIQQDAEKTIIDAIRRAGLEVT